MIQNDEESRRLASLHSLRILDTPPEASYDEIARLATVVCETPIAQLSFVDRDRRWLKAKVGMRAGEIPREIAFCSQAILQSGFFQVSDARQDSRFSDNPQVIGEPYLRFYAGFPISIADGANLGMLAVIDRMPRTLTPLQIDVLRVLAAQVGAQLALRKHLTVAVEAKAELRASEERFRGMFEQLAEGFCLVDADDGSVLSANAALLEMLGFTPDALLRLTIFDIAAEHERAHIRADFERARAEGRCCLGARRYLRRDGSVVDVSVSISFTPQGDKQIYSLILRDVTEQRQFEERLLRYQRELESTNVQLRSLASTDALTGIKNRRVFQDRLMEEFQRAKRHARALSLLVCDVDRFKEFNDAFGHPAGDEALVAVARRLQESSRAPDVLARIGGEEFAILLPDTDEAGSMVFAERARRAIATTNWRTRAITISIGAATTRAGTSSAAQLLEEADAALYRAKNAGRNRSVHAATRPLALNLPGELVVAPAAIARP